MQSDYDAIARENKSRYGWDTAPIEIIAREMYKDRTHVVFEILQNAEDASASRILFELHSDRLEVWHNGTPFNRHDVVGICGVSRSTKSGNADLIGKVGIGFKSVYAYTSHPEIHSGDEHFRIQHYVRPEAASPMRVPPPWTTRFTFPFDHDAVTPEVALEELTERLHSLDGRPLLFLQHLQELTWRDSQGNSGTLFRAAKGQLASGTCICVEAQTLGRAVSQDWLIYGREAGIASEHARRIEIAFRLVSGEKGTPEVRRARRTQLVVFFPTERETHLGFLMQGPYLTTASRSDILENDEWNRRLVEQTADLVAESLPRMRGGGLLTTESFNALPILPDGFPPDSTFRPIYERVRSELANKPLLPDAYGGYVAGKDARLARGAALIDLLPPELLAELMGSSRPIRWLHRDITLDRMSEFYRYLVGLVATSRTAGMDPLVPGLLMDSEAFARRLSDEFLRARDDEWLARFYGFLRGQEAIWRQIKNLAFIRLESGEMTRAFDERGKPLAYLPAQGRTAFPIVRRAIAARPEALQFLRALGLEEPHAAAEVLQMVVPIYEDLPDPSSISETDHDIHMLMICDAVQTSGGETLRNLLAVLRETPFLQARSAETGDGTPAFVRPGHVYRPTADLEVYFRDIPGVWFLDEREELPAKVLSDLGVRSAIAVHAKAPDREGNVTLRREWGHHVRGLDGFDPHAQIDRLDVVLQRMTEDRARVLWNDVLVHHPHLIRGVVQTSSKVSFERPESREALSTAGKLLTTTAWLPIDGTFRKPGKVSLDDLPGNFTRSEPLARALGMQVVDLHLAAETTGLPVDLVQRFRTDPDFKKFVLQHHEHVREQDARHTGPEVNPVEFTAALEEQLTRPGTGAASFEDVDADETVGNRQVTRVEARRERVQDEIRKALAQGAVRTRFSSVPQRKWEAKDNATREFLLQEYRGACQICSSGFLKANGKPYFEGLYLVPRLQAAWLDRPGNVVCLCPTCCAKMQFASVEAPGLVEQVQRLRLSGEGGRAPLCIDIVLAGSPARIRYTERHLLDLQEMMKVAP